MRIAVIALELLKFLKSAPFTRDLFLDHVVTCLIRTVSRNACKPYDLLHTVTTISTQQTYVLST